MPYSLFPGTSKLRSGLFFNTVPYKKDTFHHECVDDRIKILYYDHPIIILPIIGGGGVLSTIEYI